jgi:transposase
LSKPFLSERQDDWREGIAGAFSHFGGVPRTLLGDNARALVVGAIAGPGTVSFIRPIWPSAAIGTCSRAPARRIGPGPKAKPKPA